MFMTSSSLGPKRRKQRFLCHGVSLGLIAILTAFALRNRWRKAMKLPDMNNAYSAMVDDAEFVIKLRPVSSAKNGITNNYAALAAVQPSERMGYLYNSHESQVVHHSASRNPILWIYVDGTL